MGRTRASREEDASTIRDPVKSARPVESDLLLFPSGSTLLNLACADREAGGFPAGALVNLVGDKSAGKTLLTLSGLAEASQREDLENVFLEYDDAESANNFDLSEMFGSKLEERLSLPDPSHTIEQYTDRISNLIRRGSPFIHVLDSFDMIGSEADLEKYEKAKEAREKEKKTPGSYGTGRAKGSAEFFRLMKRDIKTTDSLLIIVSQVRENLDASGPWSPKHYRAGGKSLDHNAHLVIWLAVVEQIKKQVNGRKRTVGQWVEAKVTKNKVTGKLRSVRFPIYTDYGVDDIGSMVFFLIEEGWWRKKGNNLFIAEEFSFQGSKEDIIRMVEEGGRERDLRRITEMAWGTIEEEFKSGRKKRFS